MKRRRFNLTTGHLAKWNPLRGVTLVEILVSMGIMVAVLGIAFGMVIESERASKKIDQREMAMIYCQRIIGQTSAILRSAIASGDMTTANAAPVFESQRFSVLAMDRLTTAGLVRITVELDPTGRDGQGEITQRIEPLDGDPESAREDNFYLNLPATSQVSLEFGYAGPQQPDELTSFEPIWPAGSWPSLVRIRVMVTATDEPGQTVELETAVIPSMIPSDVRPMGNAQATPTTETQFTTDTQATTGTQSVDAATTPSEEVTQ